MEIFWNEFSQSKLSASFLIERNYVNNSWPLVLKLKDTIAQVMMLKKQGAKRET